MARALMPSKQKQYEQDKRQSEMQKATKRGDYYALTKPLWFKGTNYKSTLEASWAMYFEYNDIEYEYEPVTVTIEDGEPYTPDFYLKKSGIWIECKSPAAWSNKNKEIQRKIRGLTNIKNQQALIITAAPAYIDQGEIIEFKPNNKLVNRLEKIPTSCGGIVQTEKDYKNLGRVFYQAKEQAKYKIEYEKERDAIKEDNSDAIRFIREFLKDNYIPYDGFVKDNGIGKTYMYYGMRETWGGTLNVWKDNDLIYTHPADYADSWDNWSTKNRLQLGICYEEDNTDVSYCNEWKKTIEDWGNTLESMNINLCVELSTWNIDAIKLITEQINTHNRIPGTIKIDVSKVHEEKYYGKSSNYRNKSK